MHDWKQLMSSKALRMFKTVTYLDAGHWVSERGKTGIPQGWQRLSAFGQQPEKALLHTLPLPFAPFEESSLAACTCDTVFQN